MHDIKYKLLIKNINKKNLKMIKRYFMRFIVIFVNIFKAIQQYNSIIYSIADRKKCAMSIIKLYCICQKKVWKFRLCEMVELNSALNFTVTISFFILPRSTI